MSRILLNAVLSCCVAGAVCADPVSWQLPPVEGGVDYQLGGAYPPDPRVVIVARDSTAQPSAGHYNICYVNGFQTQPGELDWWLANHPHALLRADKGAPVSDPGWPDEYALDTRSAPARDSIVETMTAVLERCAAAGFDAVEFDNLDTSSRFDALTVDGNLELAARLVDSAHRLGLAAGQKNAPDLGERGPKAGFDFVISEECARWNECADYRAHYGRHHIDIEYSDDLPPDTTFQQLCRLPDQPTLTVLRDRMLTVAGHADYVFELCAPN